MKRWGLYEWSVILFFAILPISAILIEVFLFAAPLSAALYLKWFVFSIVGLRLLSAGAKQVISPSFTAHEIFAVNDDKALPLVREIGFANISFGILGMLSLFLPEFRLAAAVVGGLYFFFAALGHIFSKQKANTEIFPMITDLAAFLILLILYMLAVL